MTKLRFYYLNKSRNSGFLFVQSNTAWGPHVSMPCWNIVNSTVTSCQMTLLFWIYYLIAFIMIMQYWPLASSYVCSNKMPRCGLCACWCISKRNSIALRAALFFVVHMRYHTCSPLNSSSLLFRCQNLQRFISTMSKATKRKHVVKEVLEDYVTPTEDQHIMRVQLQFLRSVRLWELSILIIPCY